ncbi:pseudouridine synthase [Anaeromyces robustus]|uniref:Pseudouridine synthase n=1 Tax=Anaeromyces robustus TaxID=1754192 RepID=A0A1Y1X9U9_9FUNG|nr:pseudouridine synthase [Anaeromyces robustus]|eukprot:ORX82196.1 pseudouridine synthase [Anaeromyces robustus]
MEEKKKKEIIEIPGFDSRYNRHFKIPIIYHDENFLIVNKPYDLRIDGATTDCDTEESLLLTKFPEYKGCLKLIHQLDYSTSGIHCWGLNKNAARRATRSFRQHKVKKTYVAIVRGFIEKDKFEIEKPIAKDPNHERRMMIGTKENPGKEAKTLVEVLKRGYFHPILCTSSDEYSENTEEGKKDKDKSTEDLVMKATLVKLHPYTGRTHQLRVHLQSIGHPIIGDYNYEKPFTDHERMMLHAMKIIIPLENENEKEKEKGYDNNHQKINNSLKNNNKKLKIDHESFNDGKNDDPKLTHKNDMEDIILETENPFENLLSDNK